jgi:malonyl-CoA/methylmalonyl-CoA synthetase
MTKPQDQDTLAIITRARCHPGATAVVDRRGPHGYAELLEAADRIAAGLLAGAADLGEARVAFRVGPGFEWVAALWGIWRAGGIAVPLALSHPAPELDYTIADSGAALVLADDTAPELEAIAARHGARFLRVSALRAAYPVALPAVGATRRALMVYTSGTTGRPKGVVTTHANLEAQITALIEAWDWSERDRILLVLPLHHVHGIVNVVLCGLWAGATVEMPAGFAADAVWDRLAAGELTVFMAVPTIYRKLIAAWEAAAQDRQVGWSAGGRRLRLMVSGSAALPVATLEAWRAITGHTLLERYGMTELGMALSNPLNGERRPGYVGAPLPGVSVRLVDPDGRAVAEGAPGEIEVRGANVFLEYWNRPEETAAAFRDGWFRTGDTAVREQGAYRILGRSSVDIIKTGGYKVSALEIEEVLRQHEAVAECAVVGLADPEWGERIAVAVELAPGRTLTLAELLPWARERLAPYKLPRALCCVAALPRNAMGKVVKPEVGRLFS